MVVVVSVGLMVVVGMVVVWVMMVSWVDDEIFFLIYGLFRNFPFYLLI